jgi:hypothetical protein
LIIDGTGRGALYGKRVFGVHESEYPPLDRLGLSA